MPTTPQHTFSKAEKLCSDTAIERLFTDGQSVAKFPLRAVYRQNDSDVTRVLISVSKKRFHHAVDRNRVKRLVREAYRLNKQLLNVPQTLDLAFIFIGNKLPDYNAITKSVITIIERINSATNDSSTDK
ncbi:MAG: ribonuclease P protein component [Bacteroidales bacterium]|nr:ribonuclease P protein component [Bacteroidales bacterium]